MKVGFSGTRNGMTEAQVAFVREYLVAKEAFELHHGDCKGADEQAHWIAWGDLRLRVVIHPPKIATMRANCQGGWVLPPMPYIERNHRIVDATDILLAAPKAGMAQDHRSGTWATIRYAHQLRKPLAVVLPNGSCLHTTPRSAGIRLEDCL